MLCLQDDGSLGGDLADGGDPVVRYLISAGADINSQDKYGLTPLHFAAMRGNEVATKELLRFKGIDIEVSWCSLQVIVALHFCTLCYWQFRLKTLFRQKKRYMESGPCCFVKEGQQFIPP